MELCSYGCGQFAIKKFKNGKYCCSEWTQLCPKVKGKNSKSHNGLGHTTETRKKLSMKAKNRFKNRENHPFLGRSHSEKTKKLISKQSKGRIIFSEEQKLEKSINMCGELNPNWKGGISLEPYCFEFTNELKEFIKIRDFYKCKNPKCYKISHKLCIHHIDYDKKNCKPNNLITLCFSCNSKANFDREYWKNFYNKCISKGE